MNERRFVRVEDKIVDVFQILHISPIKSGKLFIITFKNNEPIMWLSKDEFEKLTKKIIPKKVKSEANTIPLTNT